MIRMTPPTEKKQEEQDPWGGALDAELESKLMEARHKTAAAAATPPPEKKNKIPMRDAGVAELETMWMAAEQKNATAAAVPTTERKNKIPRRGPGIGELERVWTEEEMNAACAAAAATPPPWLVSTAVPPHAMSPAMRPRVDPSSLPISPSFLGGLPNQQAAYGYAAAGATARSSSSGFLPSNESAVQLETMWMAAEQKAATAAAVPTTERKNKIPRRGPGIGELERVLTEEEVNAACAAAAATPPPWLVSTAVPPHAMSPAMRPRVDPSSLPISPSFLGGLPNQQAAYGYAAAGATARSSSSGFLPSNESAVGPRQAEATLGSSQSHLISPNFLELMHWQQYHQQQRIAAMVKFPSMHGHKLQIGHPSHRNYTGSNIQQRETMAGTKRRYSFEQDRQWIYDHPRNVPTLPSTLEQSLPSERDSAVFSETQSTALGGCDFGSSVLNTSSEVKVDREGKQYDGTLDGAILTLRPPERQNLEPVLNPAISSLDYSDYSSVLLQGSLDTSSTPDRPFYNFLPISDEDHETTSSENKEAKKDFDLKKP